MFYAYVLQSVKSRKLYVGYSSDLKRRIREHLNGKGYTTSRMGVIELIYYEAYKAEADAGRREGYLKTTQGKRTLKLMLGESLKQVSPVSVQSTIQGKGPIV